MNAKVVRELLTSIEVDRERGKGIEQQIKLLRSEQEGLFRQIEQKHGEALGYLELEYQTHGTTDRKIILNGDIAYVLSDGALYRTDVVDLFIETGGSDDVIDQMLGEVMEGAEQAAENTGQTLEQAFADGTY